jgi:hypothetical protein
MLGGSISCVEAKARGEERGGEKERVEENGKGV